MRIFPLIAFLFLLAGPVWSQAFRWDEAAALARPEEELVNSIVARLLLSREVAWTKFCNHAKVRDLAREAKVLADLKQEGRKIGLTPEEVSCFFKPQIASSCRLQEEMIMGWASGLPRPSTPPKDLQGEIRPLIDKLDRTLLHQWKAVCSKSFDRADFYAARGLIEGQGIPAEVAKIAAQPLLSRSLP
jgi:chorismate mutase-like protein